MDIDPMDVRPLVGAQKHVMARELRGSLSALTVAMAEDEVARAIQRQLETSSLTADDVHIWWVCHGEAVARS